MATTEAGSASGSSSAPVHDVEAPKVNGEGSTSVAEQAEEGQTTIDEALLPFDLSLHFPQRPLLPSTAEALGLPATPSPLKLAVQPTETLNDIRLTLADSPEGYWLGAYCFVRPGVGKSAQGSAERVGEWVELKDVFEGVPRDDRALHIAYAPFNEAEARAHVQRLRDLLAGSHPDPTTAAIDAGLSVQDAVRHPDLWTKEAVGYAAAQAAANNKARGSKMPAPDLAQEAAQVPFTQWSGWENKTLTDLIPKQSRPPRFFPTCLRSLAISAWSPPPQHLRMRGHFFYLQVTTLEGESIHITVSTSGFHANKSTSSRFDPAPRTAGDNSISNSIFDLLSNLSAQFLANFAKIFNEPLSARDFFAVLPMTNCIAAAPWLARNHSHTADPLRPQTAFLLTGTTSLESLEGTRDWNEELQSARELPRSTLPERHVRERALGRLFSEFARSAANAVPKVAAGEVQALNPMDKAEAQMYCVNNLFISRGVDGVDIYPYLGGDEAAHVAVSKDVQGVRMLNTVDVEGLCLLGTVIVDWHGERWVAQSIIPGLFRKRDEEEFAALTGDSSPKVQETSANGVNQSAEPSQNERPSPSDDTQVIYGGVEGPEVIRTSAAFAKVFEQVAKSLHLAKHAIKDGAEQSHDLWLSVDSKGLRGADGRKYALDVARLTPVDVEWSEQDHKGALLGGGQAEDYPHEMVLLRPELIEIYWDSEFRKWARDQLAQRQQAKDKELENKASSETPAANGDAPAAQTSDDASSSKDAPEPLDGSAFHLEFNPDAFVKFKPPTDESAKATSVVNDESDPSVAAVRAASKYLRGSAIPRLVSDVAAGLASVADGQALTRQMHARGINVRYLGHLAHLASPSQQSKLDQDTLKKTGGGPGFEVLLTILHGVALHEMVVRASKKVLNSLLRDCGKHDIAACVSHFLNCLVGQAHEPKPSAEWSPSPFGADQPPVWAELTPSSLSDRIGLEVRRRYRYSLPADFLDATARKPQLLREVCIRCGVQLKLRDYDFAAATLPGVNGSASADRASDGDSSSEAVQSKAVQAKKKKSSTGARKAVKDASSTSKAQQSTTFQPDDVLNLVPIVKDSAPTSKVAEDAFETGRLTMMSRGDRELGVDLLLEGISFHETIYGMAHPETARCYALFAAIVHQLSTLINAETAAKIREEQEKQGKEDVEVELPAYAEQLSGATALRYQRQAVTISERALGLDHSETMAQWSSLAILERVEGNLEASMRCTARVMELQDIVYGQPHPENITALSNLATTLQTARNFDLSLQVFTTAHELCLRLFGPDALTTANVAFELCQAQSLVGDLRGALETLKESVRIFEAVLGKDHAHTKDAELFLSRLAAAAVRAAKLEQHQKIREAQAAQLPSAARAAAAGRTIGANPAGGVSTSSAMSAAANAGTAPGRAGKGRNGAPAGAAGAPQSDLSVDELVKYISGGGAASAGKSSAARKGKGKALK